MRPDNEGPIVVDDDPVARTSAEVGQRRDDTIHDGHGRPQRLNRTSQAKNSRARGRRATVARWRRFVTGCGVCLVTAVTPACQQPFKPAFDVDIRVRSVVDGPTDCIVYWHAHATDGRLVSFSVWSVTYTPNRTETLLVSSTFTDSIGVARVETMPATPGSVETRWVVTTPGFHEDKWVSMRCGNTWTES